MCEDVLHEPLMVMKLQIRKELNYTPQLFDEIDVEDTRQSLMKKIESEVLKIVESISEDKPPSIRLPNQDWANVEYSDGALRMKPRTQCSTRVIRWSAPRSRPRMALLVSTLARAYKLLATRSTITRRALYYEQAGSVRSQAAVDTAVRDACSLLGAPAWQLGLLATSKALVSGPLTIAMADGELFDCSLAAGGQLVPQDVSAIRELRADTARLILVVEKDAVFQKLLDERFQEALGPCILLTAQSEDAASLVTPAVRWLGVLPGELTALGVPTQPLTDVDRHRLDTLSQRPYVRRSPALLQQVQRLLKDNHKAEIEAVAGLSREYLVRGYLPNKIRCRDVL